MPATVTHAYFAKDVIDILPESIRNSLNNKRCMMFSQSTDSLMFYNLFSIFPGRKIRKFYEYFHNNKSQEYFINLLGYVRDNKLFDDDVFSFIVGFICHYALDSTLHPYIIYKTGVFKKNYPSTYKYNNAHHFMETFIDNDMISRRTNINPYKFKINKFCFDTSKFSPELKEVIDNSFYETFDIDNMSRIYRRSLKQMKRSLRCFRRDPYGIKKFFYMLFDTFTPRKWYRFEPVSYHYPLVDKHNYLNSDNSLWRNPTTYDMTSNESFVDLYLKAVKLAKVLVCASFDYLDGKDIDLKKIFNNNSYVTGLNCNLDKELKYFEF
ncbi:MAG: zinc dependent phospholipase C family protein [Bacilli bacterium]|nr:zinc dependent phospholipase C family protein [Bacilli bacterium]